MIKFRASVDNEKRPLVGLGLSAGNVKRLMDKQPILVEGAELGLDADLLIFYGPTEEAMAADLSQFIGPETVVHGE